MSDINKKILIVEDSKSYLFIISETFRNAGFTVVTAEDGEAGLAMAEQEKPDLILLDITMPKMDGLTMAKKIKEAGLSMPIVFLTNMSDLKHISQGLEAAEDYIVKADTSADDIVVKVKAKLRIE